MSGNLSLISELEDTMASGPDHRRHDKLRKVTDLFVANSAQYGEEQVALFGGVIGRLAKDTDTPAKAELSGRLATIKNAPVEVIKQLADDAYLAGLASTKGRSHMLAIAAREDLSEQVTDALLTHGDQQVARTVANNAPALAAALA